MTVASDFEVSVESNFEGERHKMGFDEDALPHLMAILSSQYSNPGLAVVREYSTNAIDAQVDEGWYRPIEITSPTWSSSTFSVQDWGCGMNAEDIRKIYRFYGASSKRGSDEYNGNMGIGSKSAFAYTNQFTVESNKNGIKTIVVVSRDDEGGGDMVIISETKTDLPNGTKISVPVSDTIAFNEGITKFAKQLAPGLALVDGKDISEWGTYTKVLGEVKDENGVTIINGIYHVPRTGYRYVNADRIYMAGVSYPALEELSKVRTDPPMDIMVDVPPRTVRFSPSRESLMDTKRTKDVSEFAGKVYSAHLAKRVRADVADAKSILEAVTVFQRNRTLLSPDEASTITYDGVRLSQNVVPFNIDSKSGTFVYQQYIMWEAFDDSGNDTQRRTASSGYRMDPSAMHREQPMFIKGYKQDRLPSHNKNKTQYWIRNNYTAPASYITPDGLPKVVYFFDEVPDVIKKHPILSTIDWVSWDDIAAVKMPRKPRATSTRSAAAGRRLVMTGTNPTFVLEDVAALKAKEIHYTIGGVVKNELSGSAYSRKNGGVEFSFEFLCRNYLDHQKSGAIFVNVYANSEKKFLNEFPKAIKVNTIAELRKPVFDTMLETFKKDIADRADGIAYRQNDACATLQRLAGLIGANSLRDPRLVKVASNKSERFGADTYQFAGSTDHFNEANRILKAAQAKTNAEIGEIEACYPMLSMVQWRGRTPQEARVVADYLNDIYDNTNKENE